MADTNEFKPRPCHHCGAAHGHFTDCLHKYERAIATAPDLGGLWALCNYFSRMKATPPADAALVDFLNECAIDMDIAGMSFITLQVDRDTYAKAKAAAALRAREVPEAVALLSELFAQVQGECPSLLDGDRGGDNSLCLRIASILSATDSEGRSNG